MPSNTPSRPPAQLATTARLSLHLRDLAQTEAQTNPTLLTQDHLRFQLDHALARDAVHTPLDLSLIQTGLQARGLQPVLLHSGVDAMFAPNAPAAQLRRTYLRRPDLGRTLHPDSVLYLQQLAHHQPNRDFSSRPEAHPTNTFSSRPEAHPTNTFSSRPERSGVERPASGTTTKPQASILYPPSSIPCPVLFLLADGLSALALERHALPLLDAIRTLFPLPFSLIPLVQNARVAIADPIGQILGTQITVLLIGERPGLSSADSLGCYITWAPRPGRTDAERNCISNIRGPEGLSYAEAAHRIAHYIHEAQRLQTTGTALKDPATKHLL